MKIYLPEDIWDYIFLNCDYYPIVTTRMLQPKYVKHCTKGNDFEHAIRGNNSKNLKWIYQCGGIKLKGKHFEWAARDARVSFGIMKWLKEKGCPWDSRTFASAARVGDLSKMKWLKANKCPWDSFIFNGAAIFCN